VDAVRAVQKDALAKAKGAIAAKAAAAPKG
jgi:hypothetical protein